MGATGVVVNGWVIVAHPLFLAQVEALIAQVTAARERYPETYQRKPAAKRLAAIRKLAFNDIPSDPGHARYRLGNTMGGDYRFWRRAKFFERYRLFFRYHESERVIVLAWVNDSSSLRERGSKSDAYSVFESMLGRGKPPATWKELLAESQSAEPLAPPG
ncbi:MAG: type II toxin-antitoxin system YhaV family toxin [Micrococcales bacterium]|nr:type II toxin-antitoxin system YhaV family toxin [Micrococcales bacterium]